MEASTLCSSNLEDLSVVNAQVCTELDAAGQLTRAEVVTFQGSHGLAVDGPSGNRTISELRN